MSVKNKSTKSPDDIDYIMADIDWFIRRYHQKKGYCPDNLLRIHIGDPCEFCGWDSIKQKEVPKRERQDGSEDSTVPLPKS